jgi:deferrochelatase/peroxidase EfeB
MNGAITRRQVLFGALCLTTSASASACSGDPAPVTGVRPETTGPVTRTAVAAAPGNGSRPHGIASDALPRTRLTAFDVQNPAETRALLVDWSRLAEQSGDVAVNIGVGASLVSRVAPRQMKPEALTELPAFDRDDLNPAWSNGDLLLHVTARDDDVLNATVDEATRLTRTRAALRWSQAGVAERQDTDGVSRNALGFKDGSGNPVAGDDRDSVIWTQEGDGPAWMTGGTYLVFRKIVLDLNAWHRLSNHEQEQVIGRRKASGAPLSGGHEHTPIDFTAHDEAGALAIPVDAHARRASMMFNQGVQIMRRGFTFREAGRRGLLFLAYQRDPLQGFIPLQMRLDEADALARFTTTTASAVFAIPPIGARFVGDGLFNS